MFDQKPDSFGGFQGYIARVTIGNNYIHGAFHDVIAFDEAMISSGKFDF